MTKKSVPMTDELVDYINDVSVHEAPSLRACREYTETLAQVAKMQIPPEQGNFLQWLIQTLDATRILELGTFTGYSALAMALAMPDDGRLITCDISVEWTTKAREFWELGGVSHKIESRLGPALETLQTLPSKHFDLVFIDADKRSYPDYFEACLPLVRRGGVIAIDNVLQGGQVADPLAQHSTLDIIREFNQRLYEDSRVHITLLPIADGLTLARKK